MRLPIPKTIERRMRPLMRRGEEFLRDWEWTWTTAFLAGLVISFAAITAMAVIPSFMLYFAEQNLDATIANRLRLTIRDAVVTGYLTVVAVVFVVTFYKLQVIRRRLRGEKQSERYTGGYR
jgi:ABC-type Fe3+ transport system permease subunit